MLQELFIPLHIHKTAVHEPLLKQSNQTKQFHHSDVHCFKINYYLHTVPLVNYEHAITNTGQNKWVDSYKVHTTKASSPFSSK